MNRALKALSVVADIAQAARYVTEWKGQDLELMPDRAEYKYGVELANKAVYLIPFINGANRACLIVYDKGECAEQPEYQFDWDCRTDGPVFKTLEEAIQHSQLINN